MTEKLEEPVRETAHGEDEATPARALAGVHIVVGIVAGLFIAALTFLWWYLAR